jgi:2-succinyl-5-enolpyruvyl-6-hydroxy-3-cyclohexene-1-carboxylate synthase
MIHPKQHISDLAEISYQLGTGYVVISPGSRNGPLINAFLNRFGDKCISIVDERSAGYIGLGLARASRKPCILVCTSGTAMLNYSPALAEAYYQHIPLIAVTADRPPEWIDQLDNQTIRQVNVYRNFVKASFELPTQIVKTSQLNRLHNRIKKAFNRSMQLPQGPIHINVPLAEPLYEVLPESLIKAQTLETKQTPNAMAVSKEFINIWNKAKKIIVVHGQDTPNAQLLQSLRALFEDERVLILAENISNIFHPRAIAEHDLLFAHARVNELPEPDLVIYGGGQIVSKRLKLYLRSLRHTRFWRIGTDAYYIDTFKQQNKTLATDAQVVYRSLGQHVISGRSSEFRSAWLHAREHAWQRREKILADAEFNDLIAVNLIMHAIPQQAIVELGNSSSIRYAQLVGSRSDLHYYSNRGVSGIDGCLSAAVGTALALEQLTLAIIGDMSLGYDSNALWNKKLPANLRIAVLNNEGGGIFDLIDGPSAQKGFEDFYLAHHPLDMQKLAETYNLNYFCCINSKQLLDILPAFLNSSGKAGILEIKTERRNNTAVFSELMNREGKYTLTTS